MIFRKSGFGFLAAGTVLVAIVTNGSRASAQVPGDCWIRGTNQNRLQEGCEVVEGGSTWDSVKNVTYEVRAEHWDEGWGFPLDGVRIPDGGYCRLMTGIRMLEESSAPTEHGIDAAWVNSQLPHVRPLCHGHYGQTGAGPLSRNAAIVGGAAAVGSIVAGSIGAIVGVASILGLNEYVDIGANTLFDLGPIVRASVLVHEARHYDGGGTPHQTNDCLYSQAIAEDDWSLFWPIGNYYCDEGVDSGGAWSYQVEYLEAFAAQPLSAVTPDGQRLRVTPTDVAEAVEFANYVLGRHFRHEPGYRLNDPYYDALLDALPSTFEEQAVGCTSARCTWQVVTPAAATDSCVLSKFGGAFDSELDAVGFAYETGGYRLVTNSSQATFGTSPADGDWNQVPFGVMYCRSGGQPTYHQHVLPVATEAASVDIALGEANTTRVCSIAAVRGDLNNGDEVRVYQAPDGWHLSLFSNFSNDQLLAANVTCQNGVIQAVHDLQDGSAFYQTFTNEVLCAVTRVRNDFAGIDEYIFASRSEGGGFSTPNGNATWAFFANSNRPFDAGGQIEGTIACFLPQ